MVVERQPPVLVRHVYGRGWNRHVLVDEVYVDVNEGEEQYLEQQFPAQLFPKDSIVSQVNHLQVYATGKVRLECLGS